MVLEQPWLPAHTTTTTTTTTTCRVTAITVLQNFAHKRSDEHTRSHIVSQGMPGLPSQMICCFESELYQFATFIGKNTHTHCRNTNYSLARFPIHVTQAHASFFLEPNVHM
eukprot:5459512-Amphidinium_carterae.1